MLCIYYIAFITFHCISHTSLNFCTHYIKIAVVVNDINDVDNVAYIAKNRVSRHREAQGGTGMERGLWKGKWKKKRQRRRRKRGMDEEEGEKGSIKRLFVMGA